MKGKWEIEWIDEWEKKRTNKLPNEQALRTMFATLVKQGPYDPTMATSVKTSLKNRLCILLDVFAIIPIRPVT